MKRKKTKMMLGMMMMMMMDNLDSKFIELTIVIKMEKPF